MAAPTVVQLIALGAPLTANEVKANKTRYNAYSLACRLSGACWLSWLYPNQRALYMWSPGAGRRAYLHQYVNIGSIQSTRAVQHDMAAGPIEFGTRNSERHAQWLTGGFAQANRPCCLPFWQDIFGCSRGEGGNITLFVNSACCFSMKAMGMAP